jgi:hypothetical protein
MWGGEWDRECGREWEWEWGWRLERGREWE